MITEHPMARVANGLNGHGTVNSTTLSIAFMEFLLESDSNTMKSLWRSYGWKDISPLWGDRPTVPTFKHDPAIIGQWPDFQREMTQVEADWYYLSGHHGRQFDRDTERFANNMEMNNTLSRTGFFNEPYHTGRWDRATLEDPYQGEDPQEVYMTTSEDDWGAGLGPQDNPLYNAPHEQCKGMLLVGCNTLANRQTRRMLNTYFPNAVIIGLISRETDALTKILNVIRPLGPQFFIDPKGTIDPTELAERLFTPGQFKDYVGVLADGKFHVRLKRTNVLAADEPVTHANTQ